MVTPGGTPRVLDGPVVLSVLGAITDGSDGVVQPGVGARRGSVDSGRVKLESETAGIDGNTSWADFGDGSLEIRFRVFSGGSAVG